MTFLVATYKILLPSCLKIFVPLEKNLILQFLNRYWLLFSIKLHRIRHKLNLGHLIFNKQTWQGWEIAHASGVTVESRIC